MHHRSLVPGEPFPINTIRERKLARLLGYQSPRKVEQCQVLADARAIQVGEHIGRVIEQVRLVAPRQACQGWAGERRNLRRQLTYWIHIFM